MIDNRLLLESQLKVELMLLGMDPPHALRVAVEHADELREDVARLAKELASLEPRSAFRQESAEDWALRVAGDGGKALSAYLSRTYLTPTAATAAAKKAAKLAGTER